MILNIPESIARLDELGLTYGDEIPRASMDYLIGCDPLPDNPTIEDFQQWQMARLGAVGKFLDQVRTHRGMVIVRPHGEIAIILRPEEQADYASKRFFKKFAKELNRSIKDIDCVNRENLTNLQIAQATDKSARLRTVKAMVRNSAPREETNGNR